jgi:hypothetical protein
MSTVTECSLNESRDPLVILDNQNLHIKGEILSIASFNAAKDEYSVTTYRLKNGFVVEFEVYVRLQFGLTFLSMIEGGSICHAITRRQKIRPS